MISEPRVWTADGDVRGRQEGDVAVFRGIPYAQPPVGACRFGAPLARRRWHGVRDAIAFGPRVPQSGSEQFSAFGGGGGSPDDWLTLNVWSPDLGAKGIPVMVFIHGGAYQKGSSSNPHYECGALAGAGVVVVSVNYRVGVEGFAHISGAPDNRGILDQAAALGWVQTNIAAFGGDPGNVTVFGQSAGAGSTPWAAIADGAAAPLDLLVGHTRDEYRLLAARLSPEVTDDQVSVLLDRLALGPHGASSYRCAYPDATPAELRELVMADWLLRMPSLHLAEAQLAGGGNAWTYELCWGYGPNGASHGLDLLLLLGTIDYDDIRAHGEIIAEQARHLSRRMRSDWVHFATTGDPGWAPYDTTCRSTRVYDARTTTRPYPEERSRRIWHEHLFDTLDLPAGHQPARQPNKGWRPDTPE
jgi:carboxylesterase type B